MSRETLCFKNSDCSPNELCYTNTSFIINKINSTFAKNGCECNAFFGWTGDKCSDLSVATYFFGVWAIMLFIFSFFFIFICLQTYITLVSFDLDYHFRKKGFFQVCNFSICATILCLIAFCTLFMASLNFSISSFKTNGSEIYFGIFDENAGNPYEGKFMVMHSEVYFIAYTCVCLAFLVIGNHWLEAVSRHENSSLVKNKGKRSQLKQILIMFFAVLSYIAIIPISYLVSENQIQQLLFLKFAVLPLNLFFIFLCIYAYRKLSKILIKSSQENNIDLELYKNSRSSTKLTSVFFMQDTPSGAPFVSPRGIFTSFKRENFRSSVRRVRKTQNLVVDNSIEGKSFAPGDSVEEIISRNVQSKQKKRTQAQKQWAVIKEIGLPHFVFRSTYHDEEKQQHYFTLSRANEPHEFPQRKTALAMEVLGIMLEVRCAIWTLFDAQNGEDLGGFGWKEGITPDRPFSVLKFIFYFKPTMVFMSLVFILDYIRTATFFGQNFGSVVYDDEL
eukprot:snap_masked-scaffold_18-processed-gene-4.17-mRNA-1 protein AED:1.00 eAED:1.00 QI:0/0/0/0/1/1/2/0/502